MQRQAKINAEKQTAIWFILLFYFVFIFYDIFFYYILSSKGLPSGGLGFSPHIIMLLLLPITYYLLKREKPEIIKYMYFITFSVLTIVNDLLIYWESDQNFISGNAVELIIVLFSPIFVNKRFFMVVSLGTVIRYSLVGVILQDTTVLFPLLLIFVISIMGYILLNRFFSYILALRNSYNKELEGIVKGIIATLELKDPYTKGHSERVADYALILAKATGSIKKEEYNSFYSVCLLHDIGKIHIPDYLLTKPSRLTEDEYEVIKTHPVVGAKAVEQVQGIAEYIDVIQYHHERWDGKGYPEQLKENQIPFLARIVAIADAFDAMTSSRSYRAALPLEEAYKRICAGAGTQFDPQLVHLFKKAYPEWKKYHQDFHWEEKGLAQSATTLEGGEKYENS
nr:HD-GYP domain-containing protein [Bacillus alkalicellulosilyticus]